MPDGYRTPNGFVIGPAEVTCVCEVNGTQVLRITSQYRTLEVAVSPGGRSIRAYLDGQKLTREETR